jgi:hypothetical protein
MTNRARWEEMTASPSLKKDKVQTASDKAAKVPLGSGGVGKAKEAILDRKERMRRAMEEAGI